MIEIRHYVAANGRDVFTDWLRQLRDTQAKVAILRRVNRLELGNFGDHKFLRDGDFELRVGIGPGYRVYFAKSGGAMILLLGGGDKSTQEGDIDDACINCLDRQKSKAIQELKP